MDTLKTEVGPIAFLDILGYKSFVESNKPSESAKIVKQSLHNLKPEVSQLIEKQMDGQTQSKSGYRYFKDNFKTLIVSDSIIAWISIPSDLDELSKCHVWILFFLALKLIQKKLFIEGLPLRGAISYGEFVAETSPEGMIVGKPLIDAYELSANINAAIVVLDEGIQRNLEKVPLGENSFIGFLREHLLVDYKVPLKGGSEILYLTSPWITRDDCPFSGVAAIREAIFRKFSMHNKDIGKGVDEKILNTEKYFIKVFIQLTPDTSATSVH